MVGRRSRVPKGASPAAAGRGSTHLGYSVVVDVEFGWFVHCEVLEGFMGERGRKACVVVPAFLRRV